MKFYWKVSSEQDYDYLQFYIDSTLKDQISGEVGWQQKSYSVAAGTHILKWRYVKNGSGEDGDDCAWVDFVQWTGPSPAQDPADWQEIAYKHDVLGRRVEKKVDGYSTRYLYDGGHVIAEYDGNNNLLRKYIYGPGIDQPVCMIEVADANAVYYYHFDALGSVVALSDAAGDTVQTYEYSVYGEVAVEDANHPNPYMFAGVRYDIEIGLYYNRNRCYNPFTGRFLQTDPIGYGMNWYAYCGNSPLNFLDPTGLLKDRDPNEPLTGVIYTEEGLWWGLVGEWTLEDICAWWLCEPEDVVWNEVLGIPVYVELNSRNENRNPPARRADQKGDVVFLEAGEIFDIITAITFELTEPEPARILIGRRSDGTPVDFRKPPWWPWPPDDQHRDWWRSLGETFEFLLGMMYPTGIGTQPTPVGDGTMDGAAFARAMEDAQRIDTWKAFWKSVLFEER